MYLKNKFSGCFIVIKCNLKMDGAHLKKKLTNKILKHQHK